MLLFCPTCGNVLIVEEGQKCMRFACNTCPYIHNITRKVSWLDMIPVRLSSFLGIIRVEAYRRTFSCSQVNNRKYPKLKEVDDVLGGAAAWENVDSTAGNLNVLCYSIFFRISQLAASYHKSSYGTNQDLVELQTDNPLVFTETCPKCEHPRAYFMQIQTRSADEPMTTFYKCCNAQCGHRWRDWTLCTSCDSQSCCVNSLLHNFPLTGAFYLLSPTLVETVLCLLRMILKCHFPSYCNFPLE